MRICFVSLNAHDLIANRPVPRHCGGAERQQVHLARALTARGYEVSFVCWSDGQAEGAEFDGIRVFCTRPRDAGAPFARFFGRWIDLRSALNQAKADIFYQMGADALTGQVGGWAHSAGRRFVFSAASDSDCDTDLPNLKTWRERVLYRRGLRLANQVICQTRRQQNRFSDRFGVAAQVIPSLGPVEHELVLRKPNPSRGFLWVGRIAPVKRFEWLLDLAERCPELKFHAVGASNHDSPYADSLFERAKSIPNLVTHGRLGHAELSRLYRESNALLCTSKWEGFPTTFLEAWAVGMPVVTTFDPDGVVAKRELGLVASDLAGLVAASRRIVRDAAFHKAAAHRCYHHYCSAHATDQVIAAHEREWIHPHAELADHRLLSQPDGAG